MKEKCFIYGEHAPNGTGSKNDLESGSQGNMDNSPDGEADGEGEDAE